MTFQLKSILVPVAVGSADDVVVAEHLVDAACELAKLQGAKITLVYVDAPRMALVPLDTGGASPAAYQAMAEVWEANRGAAIANLERLRTRVNEAKVPVAIDVVEPTEGPGETIAEIARERNVDLVALASHGRRGIKRLFLGSVAERVAHLADAPVLILRTADLH